MPIPRPWHDRLALPAIAAPMTAVSGPDLVIAACRSGMIGAFPTHNAPGVSAVTSVRDLVTDLTAQYAQARAE